MALEIIEGVQRGQKLYEPTREVLEAGQRRHMLTVVQHAGLGLIGLGCHGNGKAVLHLMPVKPHEIAGELTRELTESLFSEGHQMCVVQPKSEVRIHYASPLESDKERILSLRWIPDLMPSRRNVGLEAHVQETLYLN